MSRKTVILFVLVAAIPLSAFLWLGFAIAGMEQDRVGRRYQRVLEQRLNDVNLAVADYFRSVEAQLLDIPDERFSSEDQRRRLMRQHPFVRFAIVLDADGQLRYPSPSENLRREDAELLTEIAPLLTDGDLTRVSDTSEGARTSRLVQGATPGTPTQRIARAQSQGAWLVWYWRRGVNLIYRRRLSEGRVAAIVVTRSRWLADLIARLPETETSYTSSRETNDRWRIILCDSNSVPVYQWGLLETPADRAPDVEISVEPPLASWRLKYFAGGTQAPSWLGGFRGVPLLAGLIAVACGLVAILTVFFREYSRDMREAEQRVSFVNQVSHELKTPLTNIRMYADLLESDLARSSGSDANKSLQRLRVIISESQRLSRLIGNVLTFARGNRHQLKLQQVPSRVDDVVAAVIERFRPALSAERIEISTELHAPDLVELDTDALDQILGNLIGNVERYAASGRSLLIKTEQAANQTIVRVVDRGPGIPADRQADIFRPFCRISSQIHDVAGTGIGLSISRQLAQLHGGNLTLEPSTHGATFRVVLRTPTCATGV